MKKVVMLGVLLNVWCLMAGSDTMRQAREAFDAGNYEKAHELYAAVPEKTPALWYALGNCAYRCGHCAEACALWQRASLLGGNALVRERCERNYACACKKCGVTPAERGWLLMVDGWYERFPLLYVQLFFSYRMVFFLGLGASKKIVQKFFIRSRNKPFSAVWQCSCVSLQAGGACVRGSCA